MSVKLRLDQLDDVARASGFENYKAMLQELYVVQRTALVDLAKQLHITEGRVRKHLHRYGIPLRARGGPNNVKIVMTPELYREVCRDGVPAVAERLGVESGVLYARLKKLQKPL